jgi:hypothetical protein
VLADLAYSMEPAEADLTSKVVGAGLARVVGIVEGRRRQGPKLANTDGDPLELIRATFSAPEPLAVRKRLLVNPDFEPDDPSAPTGEAERGEIAGPLRWLGREMTPAEAANSLAQFRAEANRRGWGPIEEPEGPRRWLRGSIRFEADQVLVEVNSRRRLESVTAALVKAGADQPRVEYVMNPEMDMAVPGGRLGGGRGDEPEVEAAWRESWLNEALPALDGSSPRSAASRPTSRVLLESLLRQFEYDADLVAANGERPMDVEALRAELGMRDGVFGSDGLEEDYEGS